MTHLQEVGKENERLLPDQRFWVLQAYGDIGDVPVYLVGVADTEVTNHDDNIIADSHVLGQL